MKLVHNGYTIATGSCVNQAAVVHEQDITAEYGGEYWCLGFEPNATTPLFESSIRELNVLGA